MNRFRDLPRGARALILAVVAAGAGAVLWRAPDVGRWTSADLLAWAGLTIACALLEQFTVAIAHESETENYSLTDALWIPALIFARPSVLTFAVVAGVVLGHAARGWAWYKVAYNVAQFTLAITAAEIIFGAFHLSDSLTVMDWIATTLSMLAYFSLNELFIAAILSLIEGEPLRHLLVLPEGLNLLQAAGNLTIGLLAALVWSTGPVGIPLLIAPMVLSYLAYRGWLHSRQEEQQAKERERMRTLYEAGRALFGPLDVSYDFLPFLQLVRKMVDAADVELVMVDERIRVYNSEAGATLSQPLGDGAAAPERYVSTRPGLSAYVAPVGSIEATTGVLAVHRALELTAAEGSLVDALASQVQVRRENERLFRETAEQRGQLADVIGNTSDGIFVVSPDREVLTWNPAMEVISGCSRGEAVGRPCDDVLRLRAEQKRDTSAGTGLVLTPGETRDALVSRNDGTDRWIRYTSSAMPGRAGEATGFVVVARDVTAELETERMKSDFVATVTHELRSPLTPLKGFVASLRDGLVNDAPEARSEYYEIMWRQVERLERLINDLLEVSRIEAGKLEVEVARVDVAELLHDQIAETRTQSGDREIRYDAPGGAVRALADAFRFEQIVSNLLSNAMKYSAPNTPIVVSLETSNGSVHVAVHNEGDGIALEDHDRVFDRFYRVHGEAGRRAGGFGLGLFICKRLVEAMGGSIALASAPGEWCTFSFTLRLADGPAPDGRLDAAADRGAAPAGESVSRPA
jgi:PAS domain S-box-containing protein